MSDVHTFDMVAGTWVNRTVSFTQPFAQATDLNDLIFVGWAIGGLLVTSFSDWIRSDAPQSFSVPFSFALSLLLLAVQGISYDFLMFLVILFGIANSVQSLHFLWQKNSVMHLQATAMCFINMICMFSGNFQVVLGGLLDVVHQYTGCKWGST